jgi:hypothetical protein
MCHPPALVSCYEGRNIVLGIQPQGKVDRLWPAGVLMEQLLVRALQEVLDGSLSNAILEVGIYPTKVELLPCIVACLLEGVVMKVPIVAVAVHDFDSMFNHLLFKNKLGGKYFG